MTRDDISKFWKEAYVNGMLQFEQREKFARLVAAAEREACAKLCEEKRNKYKERASKPEDARDIDQEVARIAMMTCDFNAAAIRARGEK